MEAAQLQLPEAQWSWWQCSGGQSHGSGRPSTHTLPSIIHNSILKHRAVVYTLALVVGDLKILPMLVFQAPLSIAFSS